MIIDKSGFLLMAGALAAGGAGGWLMRDSKAHHAPIDETPVVKTTPETTAQPAAVAEQQPAPAAAPAPVCDDNNGSPADCPAVGPADEGVCTNLAARRCSDFKSAFKPKVAQAAVACIRSLKGSEGCDPARVTQCGHEALMAACPDEPVTSIAATTAQNGSNAPGTTIAANTMVPNANAATPSAPPAQPSAVAQACDTILKSCTSASIQPTLADCRQTLSGMNDFGRANMVQCMAQHCGDKGLLGCEGMKNPTAQAPQ